MVSASERGAAHRKAQLAERLRAGPLWHDTGIVFVREDGLPYHPERITTLFNGVSPMPACG
jgi:hypothetical protein